MRNGWLVFGLLCCVGLVMAGCAPGGGDAPSGDEAAPAEEMVAKVDFASAVQPILEGRCGKCHGGERVKGQLRLNEKETAMKGGASGPAILPGDSAGSLLIQLVKGPVGDIDRMPPKDGYLSDEEIATLAQWVDEGANW